MGNVFSRNDEIEQLRRENQSLKRIIENRERNQTRDQNEIETTQLSINVEDYIDELLQDPSINLQYIPDVIEREMYRNVLGLVVNLLRKVCADTSVQILGQKIQLSLINNGHVDNDDSR